MEQKDSLTTKADVFLAITQIIVRLGKNDINGARAAIKTASIKLEEWVRDRPEKAADVATNPNNEVFNYNRQ